VTRWRDSGGLVIAWTVDDEEGLDLARREADNVIFENIRP
jgi:hypothetical protein